MTAPAYVFTAFGSSGDVLPTVAVARELQERGAGVTVLANEVQEHLVTDAGLPFVACSSREEYERFTRHGDVWHPTRSLPLVLAAATRAAEHAVEVVEQVVRDRPTVIVGSTLAFPGRVAARRLGLPFAMLHLQPSLLASAHDELVLPGVRHLKGAPRWLRRGLYALAERLVLRPGLMPGYRELCAKHGVAVPKGNAFAVWHDAELAIGMWPEWFGPARPDWPANMVTTDFPLYSGNTPVRDDEELERFLEDGEPPVVVTPGTGNRQARRLLEASVRGIEALGLRALVLTGFEEQVPVLGAGSAWFRYAAFERLLPRAAAVIHHGGIGTLSQGFAAGIPQLLHPMAYDQPDNAVRLQAIGTGAFLRPARFEARRVSRALDALLGSPDVRERAAELATRLARRDGAARAAEHLLTLGREAPQPSR